MNKFCCCADPELPNLSFNVTCVCCQSKVDERHVKDSTDLDVEGIEHRAKDFANFNVDKEDREEHFCCCFRMRRKRHAKAGINNKKQKVLASRNGSTA